MDGEARILQDRIEVAPLEGRRSEPLERIRGRQNKYEECGADEALHAQGVGAQPLGSERPNSATRAPNVARINDQSSIEPSWLPQTPENL